MCNLRLYIAPRKDFYELALWKGWQTHGQGINAQTVQSSNCGSDLAICGTMVSKV